MNKDTTFISIFKRIRRILESFFAVCFILALFPVEGQYPASEKRNKSLQKVGICVAFGCKKDKNRVSGALTSVQTFDIRAIVLFLP